MAAIQFLRWAHPVDGDGAIDHEQWVPMFDVGGEIITGDPVAFEVEAEPAVWLGSEDIRAAFDRAKEAVSSELHSAPEQAPRRPSRVTVEHIGNDRRTRLVMKLGDHEHSLAPEDAEALRDDLSEALLACGHTAAHQPEVPRG